MLFTLKHFFCMNAFLWQFYLSVCVYERIHAYVCERERSLESSGNGHLNKKKNHHTWNNKNVVINN